MIGRCGGRLFGVRPRCPVPSRVFGPQRVYGTGATSESAGGDRAPKSITARGRDRKTRRPADIVPHPAANICDLCHTSRPASTPTDARLPASRRNIYNCFAFGAMVYLVNPTPSQCGAREFVQ